jgi:hypothetical protein
LGGLNIISVISVNHHLAGTKAFGRCLEAKLDGMNRSNRAWRGVTRAYVGSSDSREQPRLAEAKKMEAMGLLLKAAQTDFLGTYSTGNATAITSV